MHHQHGGHQRDDRQKRPPAKEGGAQRSVCAALVHGCGAAAVQIRTAGRDVTGYSSSMGIVRDKCDERQTRIEGMIAEFRKAQARRAKTTAVHADDHAVELQPDDEAVAAVAVSAAAPPMSH